MASCVCVYFTSECIFLFCYVDTCELCYVDMCELAHESTQTYHMQTFTKLTSLQQIKRYGITNSPEPNRLIKKISCPSANKWGMHECVYRNHIMGRQHAPRSSHCLIYLFLLVSSCRACKINVSLQKIDIET